MKYEIKQEPYGYVVSNVESKYFLVSEMKTIHEFFKKKRIGSAKTVSYRKQDCIFSLLKNLMPTLSTEYLKKRNATPLILDMELFFFYHQLSENYSFVITGIVLDYKLANELLDELNKEIVWKTLST